MEMPPPWRAAWRAESGTRLMVHIGDTEKRYDPNVIRELLPLAGRRRHPHPLLQPPTPAGVLDANGKLVPEARERRPIAASGSTRRTGA